MENNFDFSSSLELNESRMARIEQRLLDMPGGLQLRLNESFPKIEIYRVTRQIYYGWPKNIESLKEVKIISPEGKEEKPSSYREDFTSFSGLGQGARRRRYILCIEKPKATIDFQI